MDAVQALSSTTTYRPRANYALAPYVFTIITDRQYQSHRHDYPIIHALTRHECYQALLRSLIPQAVNLAESRGFGDLAAGVLLLLTIIASESSPSYDEFTTVPVTGPLKQRVPRG